MGIVNKVLLSSSFFFNFLLVLHTVSAVIDTINITESIRDSESITSSGGMFEVGFFSPGNSGRWYLGMWYKNIPDMTVVWVANRDTPLTNTSGVLKVMEPGLLVLVNESNSIVWSSTTSKWVQNPVAQLLDSGNLVVRDANDDRPENFLWQSFDYPSDTFLPGMSLGWNFATGVETYITSWKSDYDPSPGEFTLHLDPTGYPQLLLKKGTSVQFRMGPWNGLTFVATPNLREVHVYQLVMIINKNEVRYREDPIDRSVIRRATLSQDGIEGRWTWDNGSRSWVIFANGPADNCGKYKLCGAYGICTVQKSPSCGCLDRFVPVDPQSWTRSDWSRGCIRRTPLNCQKGDAFLKYSGLKLPDARNCTYNTTMTLQECRMECLKNCSCTAYTQLNISGGGKWMLVLLRGLG